MIGHGLDLMPDYMDAGFKRHCLGDCPETDRGEMLELDVRNYKAISLEHVQYLAKPAYHKIGEIGPLERHAYFPPFSFGRIFKDYVQHCGSGLFEKLLKTAAVDRHAHICGVVQEFVARFFYCHG